MKNIYRLKFSRIGAFKALLLSLFLFFVSIKIGTIQNDEEEFYLPIWVETLQHYALICLVIIALVQFVLISPLRRLTVRPTEFSCAWLVMLALYYTRMAFDGYEIWKLVISYFVFLWIFYYFGVIFAECENNVKVFFIFILRSFLGFVFLFVLLNVAIYISGGGIWLHSGRYVGPTGHPNFMAVDAGFCFICFFYSMLKMGKKFLSFLGLVWSAFFLILAASRTGVIFSTIGFFVLFIPELKKMSFEKRLISFIFLCLALFVGIEFAANWDGAADAIDRLLYAGDNRSEIWNVIWGQILSSPYWGVGMSVASSESSFLRITAASGIFVGILFLVNVSIRLYKSILCAKKIDIFGPFLLAICLSIVVCSFAEGYLAEFFGLMPLVFVICGYFLDLSTMRSRKNAA